MPPSTPEGQELVRQTAYLFNEIFTDDSDVITFFTDNLEHFEDEFEDSGDEAPKEHKMVYTEMYKEFEALMEEKIVGVANQMGFEDAVEYFQTLQACLEEKEENGFAGEEVQKTLDIVIASYDYDRFIDVMRTKAKGRAAVMRDMFGGGSRGAGARKKGQEEGKDEEKVEEEKE
jgi:hypothetical protein